MPTFVSAMLRILYESGISYGDNIIKTITPLRLNGTAEYYIRQMGVKMSKEQLMGVYDESSKDCVDQMKAVNDFYIYNFKELLHL